MYVKIILNESTQSTTDGVVFNNVKLSLSKVPDFQDDVKSMPELKELVRRLIKSHTASEGVAVTIINKTRALRGFNAWADSLPQYIAVKNVDNVPELQ